MLVLLFLYIGHMALFDAFDDPVRGARAAAILALVGVVNVPIVHFSVDWWNTLHQPASILRAGGPSISAEMLWPLFVMLAAFKAWFASVLLLRMRAGLDAAKLRALRRAQAGEAPA